MNRPRSSARTLLCAGVVARERRSRQACFLITVAMCFAAIAGASFFLSSSARAPSLASTEKLVPPACVAAPAAAIAVVGPPPALAAVTTPSIKAPSSAEPSLSSIPAPKAQSINQSSSLEGRAATADTTRRPRRHAIVRGLIDEESSTVSALSVGGTRWTARAWPLSSADGDVACAAAAPAGGGPSYAAFQTRLRYASHDRMSERALLEPAVRLVHLVEPVEPDDVSGCAGHEDRAISVSASQICSSGQGPLEWPHMTSADLASVCADESKLRCLRPEFLPRGGCRGSNALDAPTNGPPWCTPWRAPVYIAELPCGMVELSFRGGDMAYAVHAESGAVLSHKRMLTDWGAPVGDPAPHTVRDFSFLATAGYAEYAGAAGHFLNELLPRLVHLDAFLPAHIPILWPPGPIPDRWLTLLREAGVVSSSREMVRDRSERTIFRARRLYVYGTLEPVLAAPVVTWFSQALLADSVSDKLVRPRLATSASLPIAPGARQKLVVLGRAGTGSRQLANGAELVASIAARFPSVDVVEVAPTLDNVEETVAAVAAATVVLSPHGAGLNNILFARRGATAVIEVGFLQEDFHLPSDYACLSRNLGLHYWLVLPISGSYGGPLTVDVERTLGVIVDALKVVSGVTS